MSNTLVWALAIALVLSLVGLGTVAWYDDASTAANLAVAEGTLALAAFTFWIIKTSQEEIEQTRKAVEAAQEQVAVAQKQAKLAQRQITISQRQADLANESLLAAVAPVLTAAHRSPNDGGTEHVKIDGLPHWDTYYTPEYLATTSVIFAKDRREVRVSAPFRNVGTGAAVIAKAFVVLSDGMEFDHFHVTNLIVEPGGRSRVTSVFAPPGGEYKVQLDELNLNIQYHNMYGTGEQWTEATIRKRPDSNEYAIQGLTLHRGPRDGSSNS